MSLDEYKVRFIVEEHERRVRAYLMERAALKARAARSQAITSRVDQSFQLAADLAKMVGRWGVWLMRQARRMRPALG